MKRFEWLVDLVNKNGWKTGVELGFGSGRTSRELLINSWLEQLTSVDIIKQKGMKILLPKYDNFKVMVMPSVQAAKEFEGQVDFVFIDADHSYKSVKADIEAWLPLTKHFICGHDYGTEKFPGVTQAVDEAFDNIVLGSNNCWGFYV